ncbi:MAG: hypothetical protein LBN20_05125, partial [Endomicrobium sp.]|nr:hypothetical protein [Endomicrobium sp.]
MKKAALRLLLAVGFSFVGSAVFGATVDISSWAGLNAYWTSASTGDVLNIDNDIAFGADLGTTYGWSDLTIDGNGNILNGNSQKGFVLNNDKHITFQAISFNNFLAVSGGIVNGEGGALKVAPISSAVFSGNINFIYNTALNKGGAIMSSYSAVNFSNALVNFTSNTAQSNSYGN